MRMGRVRQSSYDGEDALLSARLNKWQAYDRPEKGESTKMYRMRLRKYSRKTVGRQNERRKMASEGIAKVPKVIRRKEEDAKP